MVACGRVGQADGAHDGAVLPGTVLAQRRSVLGKNMLPIVELFECGPARGLVRGGRLHVAEAIGGIRVLEGEDLGRDAAAEPLGEIKRVRIFERRAFG
jgi:hypothetical protein